MRISTEEAEAAFNEALSKARSDVVQAWADEKLPLVREQRWHEYQAIERLEESIRAEFRSIIERAARSAAE